MKTNKEIESNYTIVSQQGFADVLKNNSTGFYSLHSNRFFNSFEEIITFSASSFLLTPTYLTIQVGIDKHITLEPVFLQYTNHSCEPNVFFDTTAFKLIALKEINVGDELTFFYPSTEWNMAQSFICTCGNINCLHTIKGAAYLSKEVLANYQLTDFIQSMLK